MRTFIFKSLLLSSLLFAGLSANAQGPFPMFNNRTHSVEAQPFADLSQRIWDLMADKNADAYQAKRSSPVQTPPEVWGFR